MLFVGMCQLFYCFFYCLPSKSRWWRNGEDKFLPPRLATVRPHCRLPVPHVIYKGDELSSHTYISSYFFSEALHVRCIVLFGEEALSSCLSTKHPMQRQWNNPAFAYKVTSHMEVRPCSTRSWLRYLLLGNPRPSRTPWGAFTWVVVAPPLPGALRLRTPGGVLAWCILTRSVLTQPLQRSPRLRTPRLGTPYLNIS